MKVDGSIGDPLYAPFLIRYALGGYFLLAGLYKLDNLALFVEEVQKFRILSPDLSVLYGNFLPYIEIIIGCLLIIGFLTTLAALIASLLLLSFILALGLYPNTEQLFNKDVILLAASLSLLYTGGGAMSVDRYRQTSRASAA